jgi:tetratricopeptide (TPR) repeat protein
MNPANVLARYWLAVAMEWQSRFEEAEEMAREAIVLDPFNATAHGILAWVQVHARRDADALTAATAGIELAPGNFLCRYFRATAYQAMGRTDEALADFAFLLESTRRGAWTLAGMAYTLAGARRTDEALRLRDELEARAVREYVCDSHLARANAAAGDYDRALTLLRRAVDAREIHAWTELHERAWDPVRGDPRFAAIVVRTRHDSKKALAGPTVFS